MDWSPEILKYFQYEHLREGPMQETSKYFCELAHVVCKLIPQCDERDAALRHLLQAKDAAVRAALP